MLGQDARQSSEKLSKQLKISAATVRRRLRNLLQSDLLRIVGIIDPNKFDLALAVLIALDLSNDELESALDILSKRPEIKWVSITTGRFDIIAIGLFNSTTDLSEFMTKNLSKLKGLKNSETFICLEVKKGRYVTLPQI
jgi:Lrp/AsnC family transcriptional regulator for asnA, asnC and gidA